MENQVAAAAFGGVFRPVTLGDKLQLLARLYPSDVLAITLIVDDVLQRRLLMVSETISSEPH